MIILRIFIVLYFVLLSKLIIVFRKLKTAIMTSKEGIQQMKDGYENLLKPENLKPENVIDFLAQVDAYNRELEPVLDHLESLNTIVSNYTSQLDLLLLLLSFLLPLLYLLAFISKD